MKNDLSDIGSVARLLSPERLKALVSLSGSYSTAIELHQETLKLGATLMYIIATVEIALRNVVCENLRHHFGVPHWLTQTPISFQWRIPERDKIRQALDSAQRAEYGKMSQAQKAALDALAYPGGRPPGVSHLKRAKDRRKKISVSEGKVVAELTMYFWKRLYSPEYDQSLWKPTLKRTFPHKKLTRADIASQLEAIYQSRNRLAHHEPVVHKRFKDTIKAIEFVIKHLDNDPPNENSPLARLLNDDLADVRARAIVLHSRLAAYRTILMQPNP
jgi:hypothetical protein